MKEGDVLEIEDGGRGVLRIPAVALRDAVVHATGSVNEVCGFFVRRDERDSVVYRQGRNASGDPGRTFKIDTDEIVKVVDEDGMEIVALFHSHPRGELRPSTVDFASFPSHYTQHGLIYVGGGLGQLVHYDGTGIYEIVYGVDSVKGLIWEP